MSTVIGPVEGDARSVRGQRLARQTSLRPGGTGGTVGSDAVRFVRVGADCQVRFLLPCREDQRPVSAEADARRARRITAGTRGAMHWR